MNMTDALWKVFESTGHIGAYLLYKDYSKVAATRQSDEITADLGLLEH